MMRNPLHGLLLALCTLLLATSECILPPPGGNACAEGRFLRGQRWQPFELDGNVAIWFDNMSSGWRAEDNIYYNLDQSQMKLCACNLVDNLYQDNYLIESPDSPPERTIDGMPALEFGAVQITGFQGELKESFATGESIVACGVVKNSGSTGVQDVDLYVDGKRAQTQRFPVIHNNQRQIRFHIQFAEPGPHRIAIGESAYIPVTVVGQRRSLLYHWLTLSNTILPAGSTLHARTEVRNVADHGQTAQVPLVVDGAVVQTQAVQLAPGESRTVSFELKPTQGSHQIRIGDTFPATVKVYPHRQGRFTTTDLKSTAPERPLPAGLISTPKPTVSASKSPGPTSITAKTHTASRSFRPFTGISSPRL